jgi:type VI secretion system secreted protein VgrG
MSYTQADRLIGISTPLGDDALLLRSFSGHEAISQLFRFDLDLLSEKPAISFDGIVGKQVTLNASLADGSERYWSGYISRFAQGGHDGRFTCYRAEMVPWLWFLTRTADCRIFQNKKAPDIILKIFQDLGFSDFSLRLHGNFVERDYCVQYRETDFNFVSRLMEEEGIFYFFEHANGKHTLVLANDPAEHKPCPHQSTVRYELTAGGWQEDDVVLDCFAQQEFRTGAWAYSDYNFETPSTSLIVQVAGKNPYEIYDYPGEYRKRADGDGLARIRLEEQRTPTFVVQGTSDCRAFTPGYKFDLIDHYRIDLNQSYVLTAVRHTASLGSSYGGSGGIGNSEPSYRNSFECIPATTTYRPPRITPQPAVQGCQSAVVVGPAGEEIYTDKYGRVKVQFHWDREGKMNESSSCWVRVSHPWAGKGWGSVTIPRIGQEVIVDFLEGNPDQPIIIGRVYNAQQMPPFGLPGGAVVSGFKSNSTKGGGGYNEISLNDTKGTELIQIHGQYDMDTKIEHDERVNVGNNRTETVGVDESITIGSNRTEKVGKNETITIGVNRTESVGADEKISIGSNRTETVGANETIGIGSNRTENVGSNETVTIALTRTHNVGVNDMLNVGAAQEVSVGGLQALTVGLTRVKTVGVSETANIGTSQTVSVGTSQTVNVGTDLSQKVGKNHSQTVGNNRSASVTNDDSVKVGKNLVIDAGESISIKTGDASITMKKDGTISIKGKDITIKGSGKIVVNADGDMTLKGQKINQN